MPRLIGQRNIITLGAQGIVRDASGRVLLVRLGYRPGWHLPGGGVERGEAAETALARELLEETGVVVVGAPRLIGLFAHFREFPGDHIALYEVTSWRRDRVPAPNREIVEAGFFSLDALPDGTSRGTRARLDELLSGRASSQDW